MTRRLASALLCAALMLPAPLLAQRSGSIELGAFGRNTWFGDSYGLEDGLGGGARVGFFISRGLELEATGAWTPSRGKFTDLRASVLSLSGRALYNIYFGGGHSAFILGAGVTRNSYGRSYDGSETGPGGLVGLRFGLGGTVSARIDFTADYFSSPNEEITAAPDDWHYGLQAGLSFISGSRTAAPKDSDGDGVVDDADRCADTPAGTQVDGPGCPLPEPEPAAAPAPPADSDGDGVVDTADRCANTPAGETVDANGCVPPKDDDNDGVVNENDQCPNTAAGEAVDEKGCSQAKDSDGDGVNDGADRCPNTPAGTQVDAAGCRVLFQANDSTPLVLTGVNFETGKATLLPESQTILTEVAQSLVANESIRVQVSGHTDNTGGRALNQRLSQARAESVRQFLIANGVSEDRIEAKGFGPTRPIAPNRTAAGRAQNRRVELERLN